MFDDIQYTLLVTPLRQAYPECEDEQRVFFANYTPLLTSLGFEIMLKVDDDDYSGDSRLIFRHGDFYGLLIFGWGSCSGCDALQSCTSFDDLEALRKTLFNSIRWGSAAELLNYFQTHDWEAEYSYGMTETKTFITQAIALLSRAC